MGERERKGRVGEGKGGKGRIGKGLGRRGEGLGRGEGRKNKRERWGKGSEKL